METPQTIPHAIQNYYDRELLVRALPLLLHAKFAQVRDIPMNMSDTIKFRRYERLAPNTTPLVPGVTPAGTNLSYTDVTAEVKQYGDFIVITDWLQYTTLDPVLMETSGLLGEQAGDSLDIVLREVVNAGTNAQFADATTAGSNVNRGAIASGDVVTEDELKLVIRNMKRNNVRKLTSWVSPDVGSNTRPLRPCYVGLTHPDIGFTLQDLEGWIDAEDYQNKADLMEGEIGAYKDIRFVETTNAKVFEGEGNGGIDVYSILILGANAYGISRISGKSLENIIKPLGSAGANDPLNQRASLAWKASFTGVILNDEFMTRLEVAGV